ncbi:MAG: RluA family pseudouridine synthase, partial [Spirochaetes bacterium]|nr:RluA family pseudouridine synthase [Spirochaetota bacterium]
AGSVLVNGVPVKQNYKVKTDDGIGIEVPEPEELLVEPMDLPLEVIYQDGDIAVINKDPGVVVHPGHGNWDRTLVNALLFHLRDLSSIGGVVRPGIVHRLDKDTAGIMVVAKNDAAHRGLVEQFAGRSVEKKYAAVIVGKTPLQHDTINAPIGRHRIYRHKMTVTEEGRGAVTEYTVARTWNCSMGVFSLLEIALHTGRTHQIRVHLSHMGNPIVGDPIYSKKWDKYRVPFLLLASVSLGIDHPRTGERLSFAAPLPEHMVRFMERLDRAHQ